MARRSSKWKAVILVALSFAVMGAVPRLRRHVDALEASPVPLGPGRLLVARPGRVHPPFDETLMLVWPVPEGGHQALVVNRPPSRPGGRWLGGPVKRRRTWHLGPAEGPRPEGAFEPLAGVRVYPPGVQAPEGSRRLRGHAAWGPGQLEDELRWGIWIVAEPDAHTVLEASPDLLWAEVVSANLREAAP